MPTIEIVTLASPGYHPGLARLEHSAQVHGWPLTVIRAPWRGWGTKVHAVADYARGIEADVIFYIDGYDSIFVKQYPGNIWINKPDFGYYSTEKNCWPDTSLAQQYMVDHQSPWRFLNAGQWAIPRKMFLQMVDENPIRFSDDDQLWHTHRFLSGKYNLKLDSGCEIFQSVAFHTPGEFADRKGQFVNLMTGTMPFVLHGNGNTDMTPYEKYGL